MLQQNTTEAIRLKEKGNVFFNQKNYVEAINCYDQAIVIHPKFKEAWLNKALCHQQLNQTHNALTAFTKAIEIDPNYAKAVFKKAELLGSIQLYELALETIDRYLAQGGMDKEIISLRKGCAEKQIKQTGKSNKLYLYVKQGHYCCWEYDPAQPQSLAYGFYAEKFFNCIIFVFKSADKKRIAMFHAEYYTHLQDIKDIMAWVGKDCSKIAYLKEHAEANETFDNLFKRELNLKKTFTIKLIKARRNKGKIILDPSVARLPDGSLAPEFEQDVVWADCGTDFASKYHSDHTTIDDDRVIKKLYQELQAAENQTFTNKASSKSNEYLAFLSEDINSEEHLNRLYNVIMSGDYGNLRSCLDYPAQDVNAYLSIDRRCYTLLALAAAEGKTELVELLLSRGAAVDLQIILGSARKKGGTALFLAAGRGHFDIVKKLLAAGANPTTTTDAGNMPISIAIQQGHQDIAVFLEQAITNTQTPLKKQPSNQGASKKSVPLPQNQSKNSIQQKNLAAQKTNLLQQLLGVIRSGNVKGLQATIDAGADINTLLITGQFPLYIPHKNYESASSFSQESLARFGKAQPAFGEYPLYLAAGLGKLAIVDCLLRNGAKVNQTDNYGLTALMIAIHMGYTDVALRLLAELTIKVNHAIQDGSTALIFACEKGIKIVVEKLIEMGAEVSQADEEGESPLIVALKHKALVPVLLHAGANPNQCTLTGVSPLFFAAQSNQLDSLQQLIFFGAHLDLVRKRDGLTALMIAAHEGHTPIVFYLLACGVDYKVKCRNQLAAIDYAKNNNQKIVYTQLLEYQKKQADCLSQHEKAMLLFKKADYLSALAIFEALSKQYHALYPQEISLDLANCYCHIAECYIKLGKIIGSATDYFKKYHDIYCALLGKKHPLTTQAKLNWDEAIKQSPEKLFFQDIHRLNLLSNPKGTQHTAVDLHGCSVRETKAILADVLSKSDTNHLTEFYVITGWGKHTNTHGHRGVLKKILPELLRPYALSMADIQEEKGAYKIILKRVETLEKQQQELYQTCFNETEIQKLIRIHKEEIKQGNTISMILLADLYLHSDSSEQENNAEALNLLHQAKAKGSMIACIKLGELYREGRKVNRNLKKAFACFNEAANKDEPLGYYWMGVCYLSGECVKRDDALGFFWIKKAADAGIAYAQHTLAESYFKGDFTPLSQTMAFDYYKKAADQGLVSSQVTVARHYACGYGVPPDYLKAFHYYWLAAQHEDTYAICQVGSYLQSGRIGEPDFVSSFQWLLKGAKLGDADCQAMVAIRYYYGKGVEQNIEKAVTWVTKAKLGNRKEALYLLSQMHFTCVGAIQDEHKAIIYLTEAAEAGFEMAQQELVARYMTGSGVAKDTLKATQLRKHYLAIPNENVVPSHARQSHSQSPEKPSAENDAYWLNKTKIDDTTLITLLKEKTQLTWYGLCDREYYVNAVTEISNEQQGQAAQMIQTSFEGYGHFFSSQGRQYYAIEKINEQSVGKELAQYLSGYRK